MLSDPFGITLWVMMGFSEKTTHVPAGQRPGLPYGRMIAIAAVVAMAWTPGCTTGDDDTDLPTPDPITSTMEAIAGRGGVAVAFDVPPASGTELVAIHGYEDSRIVEVAGGTMTVDPEGVAGVRYELLDGGEVRLSADAVEAGGSVAFVPDPALLMAGEALTAELTLEPADGSLAVGDVVITRQILGSDEVLFLDPTCVALDGLEAACWLDLPAALLEDADRTMLAELATVVIPPHSPQVDSLQVEEIGLAWRLVDSQDRAVLAGVSGQAIFTGLDLRFGDLHGHTNLSHDGCEYADDFCSAREAGPGGDYFANAVDAGLDFAAITDHAEWDELSINEAEPLVIWDESQRLVTEAEALFGPAFVPLLGYEWTASQPDVMVQEGDDANDYRDSFEAGHKTVLFAETEVCEPYRVSSDIEVENFLRDVQHYYRADPHYMAHSTVELYEQFDIAAAECDPQELLTFFHHTTVYHPYPVDWAQEDNVPRENYEMLVEIVSGHASAECRDITQDGCDFLTELDSNNQYLTWGSVQEALTLGYRLGFLGGGDRHDGRPGALGPEPSNMGYLTDEDGNGIAETPRQMAANGAITGVYVDGELDRDRLWNGLLARRTLATTGPRGPVVVVGQSHTGVVYLPGTVVPAAEFPLTILIRTVVEPDYVLDRIEVIEPTAGDVLAWTEETSLVFELETVEAPAIYVRLRYLDGDEEHRVFVSPWFLDE